LSSQHCPWPHWLIRAQDDRAEVEWTFPLDFVEVIWGDGVKAGSKIVTATRSPAHGPPPFQHSVRRDRSEVGAVCRVGFSRQRRARSAHEDCTMIMAGAVAALLSYFVPACCNS
jgi:hypothetical protein